MEPARLVMLDNEELDPLAEAGAEAMSHTSA